MSVEFESDLAGRSYRPTSVPPSKLETMVIKMGLAKDHKSAQTVFAVVSVICLTAAIYLFWTQNSPASPSVGQISAPVVAPTNQVKPAVKP